MILLVIVLFYAAMQPPAPIITLTSDFGLADAYVAAMKAAILRHCPAARLVDVTHLVPRHEIVYGSIMLERAVDAFGPGTIHLAVVDPGVGSPRRLIIVRVADQSIVCPDNGLITWAWRRHGGQTVRELTWRPPQASAVFHGRDILAPVAGRLAAGEPLASLSGTITDPLLLEIDLSAGPTGHTIYIDHFGNAMTNLPRAAIPDGVTVRVKSRDIGPVRRTYADVAAGQPLALIGSADLLEIAIREDSAAQRFGLQVGDAVELA